MPNIPAATMLGIASLTPTYLYCATLRSRKANWPCLIGFRHGVKNLPPTLNYTVGWAERSDAQHSRSDDGGDRYAHPNLRTYGPTSTLRSD